jgi:hypothetical protein
LLSKGPRSALLLIEIGLDDVAGDGSGPRAVLPVFQEDRHDDLGRLTGCEGYEPAVVEQSRIVVLEG